MVGPRQGFAPTTPNGTHGGPDFNDGNPSAPTSAGGGGGKGAQGAYTGVATHDATDDISGEGGNGGGGDRQRWGAGWGGGAAGIYGTKRAVIGPNGTNAAGANKGAGGPAGPGGSLTLRGVSSSSGAAGAGGAVGARGYATLPLSSPVSRTSGGGGNPFHDAPSGIDDMEGATNRGIDSPQFEGVTGASRRNNAVFPPAQIGGGTGGSSTAASSVASMGVTPRDGRGREVEMVPMPPQQLPSSSVPTAFTQAAAFTSAPGGEGGSPASYSAGAAATATAPYAYSGPGDTTAAAATVSRGGGGVEDDPSALTRGPSEGVYATPQLPPPPSYEHAIRGGDPDATSGGE